MKKLHGLIVATLVLGATSGIALPLANAEQAPPKGNKGLTVAAKQSIELGPEIENMNNRQLRMRVLTIEPGGHIGKHSHKGRPAEAYVLSGVDTVTYADGTQKVLKAGDTTFGNKDTTHWHQNNGTEPVVLLVVDVFNNEKK